MLNDADSIFLAMNKPMKDTWNNGKFFTHIPLDAFFYSFKQITEVFIQGNLVSKRDKPQRGVPDKISKTMNFGFDFNQTGILYKIIHTGENTIEYQAFEDAEVEPAFQAAE